MARNGPKILVCCMNSIIFESIAYLIRSTIMNIIRGDTDNVIIPEKKNTFNIVTVVLIGNDL